MLETLQHGASASSANVLLFLLVSHRRLKRMLVFGVQNVVVIGGGAFACEAMRAAVNNGAANVVMVTREKSKCTITPTSYRALSTLHHRLLDSTCFHTAFFCCNSICKQHTLLRNVQNNLRPLA